MINDTEQRSLQNVTILKIDNQGIVSVGEVSQQQFHHKSAIYHLHSNGKAFIALQKHAEIRFTGNHILKGRKFMTDRM